MISQPALQSSLLSLLCYDPIAVSLAYRLETKLFLGRNNKLIAQAAIDYIQEFKCPPGAQIELLLEAQLRRGEDGKQLRISLDAIKAQYPNLQSDYIISQLTTFEMVQQMTAAATDALEALDRNDIETAKKCFYAPISSSSVRTDGIWMHDTRKMFSWLDRVDAEFFSSGIEAIDAIKATPDRKTITFMIAASGKGKSWFLINAAKAGIQHHHQVLYITLELSEENVAKRLLQSLFGMTANDAQDVRVPYFDRDRTTGGVTLQFNRVTRDSILNKRKDLERKLDDMISYPKLLIKEFSTGSLATHELDAYLDALQREYDFVPDILIVDYPELMRMNTDQLRLEIGRVWRELRGIAGTRNLAVIAASQGTRDSEDSKVVKTTHAAEDWSKVGTGDTIYTYSQTPAEFRLGLSRIFVAKSRNAMDRVMVLNNQSYAIGQFSLDSEIMRRDVASEVKRLTDEETEAAEEERVMS